MSNKLTENQKRHLKAVRALKNNTKKAQNIMRRSNGARCCLCVIEDAAIEDGLMIDKCDLVSSVPKFNTAEWYEWDEDNGEAKSTDPILKVLPDFNMRASVINDSHLNVPHSIIAEFYANTFTRKRFKLSDKAKRFANLLKKNN